MSDRIAHRGPDADRRLRLRRRDVRVHLGAPTAVDHRPVGGGGPAVHQGRPDARLQRRALQLPGAARRAGRVAASASGPARDTEVVLEAWRRWGPDALRAVPRDVRVRAARRATAAAVPGPRPARHQAAVLPAAGHGGVVFASELKALVAAVGPELAHRARRPGRVDPLLLGARAAAAPSTACDKLPPGSLGRVPAGRQLRRETVLARRRRRRRGRGRAAAPTCATVIEESVAAHLVADVPVSTFLCGGLDSSIVTVLAKRHDPGDRRVHDHLPGRGPAARGDARRRDLRAQGGRSSSASTCTRSRSPRTSSSCCRGSSTSSTSRSATRRRSTRC